MYRHTRQNPLTTTQHIDTMYYRHLMSTSHIISACRHKTCRQLRSCVVTSDNVCAANTRATTERQVQRKDNVQCKNYILSATLTNLEHTRRRVHEIRSLSLIVKLSIRGVRQETYLSPKNTLSVVSLICMYSSGRVNGSDRWGHLTCLSM